MRAIKIIGAGQSGLQLSIGLLRHGYDVTVVTNRNRREVGQGRVLSSQCMFNMALQHERDVGLNLWDRECPPIDGIGLTIVDTDGSRAIDWAARLDAPAQSVDQRVKMPAWMDEFERLGGKLSIMQVSLDELDQLAGDADLVLVASGKGEVGRIFKRDNEKSTFDQPMRALSLTYVADMVPRDEYAAVCFNIIPGIGEYFVFPALTTTGPCEVMVFEGIPGGPMDCWAEVKSPGQHLQKSKQILEHFLPWEAERCRDIQLTDDNGILAGRFSPIIKEPIGRLPSGAAVLGMADTVCLNDPITGQGSNNASKSAAIYLDAIVSRESGPFDDEWMQQTFDAYWDYAQWVTHWTNSLLLPPTENMQKLLGAAQTRPELASRIVNGFSDPTTFFPWWDDPQAADRLINSAA
ncbi:MAG: styrene monooxygenase/indole monooxygenase family protein [Gammaproteobacteria bacterium]